MAETFHLDFSVRRSPGSLVRQLRIQREGGGPATEVTFEIAIAGTHDHPRALDGHVFGLLPHIMGTGLPLRVHGPVSRTAMHNLEEVQAY